MVEGEVALHDVAALKPILKEAGGVFLTLHDAPLITGFKEGTLSANRNLAEGCGSCWDSEIPSSSPSRPRQELNRSSAGGSGSTARHGAGRAACCTEGAPPR
jgi:hypothetical protein